MFVPRWYNCALRLKRSFRLQFREVVCEFFGHCCLPLSSSLSGQNVHESEKVLAICIDSPSLESKRPIEHPPISSSTIILEDKLGHCSDSRRNADWMTVRSLRTPLNFATRPRYHRLLVKHLRYNYLFWEKIMEITWNLHSNDRGGGDRPILSPRDDQSIVSGNGQRTEISQKILDLPIWNQFLLLIPSKPVKICQKVWVGVTRREWIGHAHPYQKRRKELQLPHRSELKLNDPKNEEKEEKMGLTQSLRKSNYKRSESHCSSRDRVLAFRACPTASSSSLTLSVQDDLWNLLQVCGAYRDVSLHFKVESLTYILRNPKACYIHLAYWFDNLKQSVLLSSKPPDWSNTTIKSFDPLCSFYADPQDDTSSALDFCDVLEVFQFYARTYLNDAIAKTLTCSTQLCDSYRSFVLGVPCLITNANVVPTFKHWDVCHFPESRSAFNNPSSGGLHSSATSFEPFHDLQSTVLQTHALRLVIGTLDDSLHSQPNKRSRVFQNDSSVQLNSILYELNLNLKFPSFTYTGSSTLSSLFSSSSGEAERPFFAPSLPGEEGTCFSSLSSSLLSSSSDLLSQSLSSLCLLCSSSSPNVSLFPPPPSDLPASLACSTEMKDQLAFTTEDWHVCKGQADNAYSSNRRPGVERSHPPFDACRLLSTSDFSEYFRRVAKSVRVVPRGFLNSLFPLGQSIWLRKEERLSIQRKISPSSGMQDLQSHQRVTWVKAIVQRFTRKGMGVFLIASNEKEAFWTTMRNGQPGHSPLQRLRVLRNSEAMSLEFLFSNFNIKDWSWTIDCQFSTRYVCCIGFEYQNQVVNKMRQALEAQILPLDLLHLIENYLLSSDKQTN